MTNSELDDFFAERFSEIEDYLDFLVNVDEASKKGAPTFRNTDAKISTQQKKILYSSFFLQLYNVVEATITQCVDQVRLAIIQSNSNPTQLRKELFIEWVKHTAKTNVVQTPENRLKAALSILDKRDLPLSDFNIGLGGGGNWDDLEIERLCDRLGCELKVPNSVNTSVKKFVHDKQGTLTFIKARRNSLAHGSISFVECSDSVAISDLRNYAETVKLYLLEVIGAFTTYRENLVSS